MKIQAIKTHAIQVGERLTDILDRYLITLEEQCLVAMTSKVVSLCQGRVMLKQEVSKEALIKQEADAFLGDDPGIYGHYLTLKHNLLIPSAGIDESNGNGFYILYPTNIQDTVRFIWEYLRKKHHIEHLGVLMTDSHTTPLRRGVVGVSLGWCGFEPLYSYIGKPDIFGAPLRVTQMNLLDALAASAVLVMGEGAEQTPLVIIQNAPKVQFLQRPPTLDEQHQVSISMEEDIYAPILQRGKWRFKK